jgi:hypothetical protein
MTIEQLINQPEFANLDAGQLANALSRAEEVPNKVPCPRIAKTIITGKELRIWLAAALDRILFADPPKKELVAKWSALSSARMTLAADSDEYIVGGEALNKWAGLLIADGMVSREELTEFTTMPDPDWQATIFLPAPVEQVLGTGARIAVYELPEKYRENGTKQ